MVLAETSDVAPGNTIMRASSMRATNLSENGLASCMKSIGAFLIHRGQGRWIMGELVKGVENIPVNYAMRFSGPVTTSPPAASGMASDPALSVSSVLRQV